MIKQVLTVGALEGVTPGPHDFFESDVNITNSVKIILLIEPLLFNTDICVETHNKLVQLTGSVNNQFELLHLQRLIKELQVYVNITSQVQILQTALPD